VSERNNLFHFGLPLPQNPLFRGVSSVYLIRTRSRSNWLSLSMHGADVSPFDAGHNAERENKKGFRQRRCREKKRLMIFKRLRDWLQVHFPSIWKLPRAAHGVKCITLNPKIHPPFIFISALRGVIKTESLFCVVLNTSWDDCAAALLCCSAQSRATLSPFLIALHWNMMTFRDAKAYY
jgi:hypothetical protein